MKRETKATAAVTAAQIEQTAVAQAEFLELMKRLVRDGFDWTCVISGAGTAMAQMIGGIAGPAKVPAHFATLSALTADLATGQKH